MTDHINSNDVIPPSGITRVILNNKERNKDDLASLIPALSDRDILIQKSGYIFNSSFSDNSFCLGLLPCCIGGQRTHHYEIDLPEKGKCVLFGFISPNETLAILFKPGKDIYNGVFLTGIAEIFRKNYILLARFLLENGFSEHFGIDFATKNLLEEAKLFATPPTTLKELALQLD